MYFALLLWLFMFKKKTKKNLAWEKLALFHQFKLLQWTLISKGIEKLSEQTGSTSHHTYMRWVESGVQSGRYFAPISRAFSLSSPRKGFWKPLRTNTTPSMIRLNGTCGTFSDLAFCCLGLGSGFFSADLWAEEAGDKQRLFRKNTIWKQRTGHRGGRYPSGWTDWVC